MSDKKYYPPKGMLVSYQGRNYRIKYAGPTKFGEKACLTYHLGDKEFWVDLSQIGKPVTTWYIEHPRTGTHVF